MVDEDPAMVTEGPTTTKVPMMNMTMTMMMSPPKARYKLEARRRRRRRETTKSGASDASDETEMAVDDETRARANARRANDRAADRSGRERESTTTA